MSPVHSLLHYVLNVYVHRLKKIRHRGMFTHTYAKYVIRRLCFLRSLYSSSSSFSLLSHSLRLLSQREYARLAFFSAFSLLLLNTEVLLYILYTRSLWPPTPRGQGHKGCESAALRRFFVPCLAALSALFSGSLLQYPIFARFCLFV